MQQRFGSSKYWQERAEEARALAEGMTDQEAKHEMLIVAESCEKLAKRAEAREAVDMSGEQRYLKGPVRG